MRAAFAKGCSEDERSPHVDYSMFYLRRKLEERYAGHDGDTALARAAATSGRAVLISGMTVMGAKGESRAWSWVIDHVLRVPAPSCGLGAALLIALAFPALNMHTVSPGTVGLPRSLAIMQTYDRIETAFPGSPIPAIVVVRAPNVTAGGVRRGVAAMARAALAMPTMRGPVLASVSPDRTVETVTVSLAGSGTDARSEAALASLRNRIIPATIGRVPSVSAYVTGTTA